MKRVLLYLVFHVFFWVDSVHGFQSFSRADSLELAVRLSQTSRERVESMLELADVLKFGQPERALDLLELARNISDSIKDKPLLMRSFRQLAEVSWITSDYRRSLLNADEALQLADKLGALTDKAVILRIFAIVMLELGDYDKSAQYFFESLKLYEKLDDKTGLSKSLNSIGNLYAEQGNNEKAEEYFSLSLTLSREIGDLDGVARGLNNLSSVLDFKTDSQLIRQLLLEAVRINQQKGQRLWEGTNYMNLGTLYLNIEVPDSARYYFLLSQDIFEELNHIPKKISSLMGLAKYYKLKGFSHKAFEYAYQALHLGKLHHQRKPLTEVADWLHQSWLELGNTDSAYVYGIMHYQIKDSLAAEHNVTRISQLEIMHEYERERQNQALEAKKRELRYLLLMGGVLFLMVTSIIILVSRQKVKNKKASFEKQSMEASLEIKNKELTLNVMSLMKKYEVISDIANRLIGIEAEVEEESTKTAIRKVIKELKKTSDNDVWEEFEVRFRQVHEAFYQKLIQRFPELSPNEIKICAFIRLNLSSKEISELTGQRIATIEIARSRLRKKLGIGNTQINLVNFLSQI